MNDLKVGTLINYNGAPYQIIRTDHLKQARSAAVLRTKMRNLISGQVLEYTFKSGETIIPADIENKKMNFLYRDEKGATFMDNSTFEQFTLVSTVVGEARNYIKEGEDVEIMMFESKPVAVALPPKVVLKVVEAPPGVKGDSATNVTKKVKVETGYELATPLFIEEGDNIRINTQTGQYVERE